MFDADRETRLTLERLLPRLRPALNDADFAIFSARLRQHFPTLFRLLLKLYGTHYDFLYHLEYILLTAAEAFKLRPPAVRALDERRLRAVLVYILRGDRLRAVRRSVRAASLPASASKSRTSKSSG